MHHNLSLRGKLVIMFSVMASLFLVALDQTIISTALGTIVEDFNAFGSLSWVVTAYLLTTTVTTPIAGKLSDLFGRRLMLLIGVAVFGLGSLLSGMSGSIDQLIAARAFQGIGGGIITANAFTIIGDLFSARERGKWQGLFGAVFGIASVVGPLLGGWLTDGRGVLGITTDWRWTFYINVPIAVIAFALIMYYCPSLRRSAKPRIDYLGAGLLAAILALIVLVVDNTELTFAGLLESTGLTVAALRIGMVVLTGILLAALIVVERRATEPVLPIKYFNQPNFLRIIGISTLFGAGFMGAILYLTQFNQQVFGATPTESGLMLLPMMAGLMIASIGSGQIISRLGRYKIFMQVGIVVAAVSIGLLTTLTPESAYWHEAVMIAFVGFGLGLVMPVLNIAVQSEFSQRELGVATSSVQLFRGLGATIGIAVLGTMLTGGVSSKLSDVNENQYVSVVRASPLAEQFGDLSDPNVLLSLNNQAVKDEITLRFEASIPSTDSMKNNATLQEFKAAQNEFSNQITHAFSETLSRIFFVSASLMTIAAVLVFNLKERSLAVNNAAQITDL